MEPPGRIVVEALVHKLEEPAFVGASEQLEKHLTGASGAVWPTRLVFHDSVSSINRSRSSALIIASLLRSAEQIDEDFAVAEARWRCDLSALAPDDLRPVFLCTVFRCIAHTSEHDRVRRMLMLERIRRLNFMAAELSHATGAYIMDFDRVFARFGGRILQTDYGLRGHLATEVAAYTIVATVLGAGLDKLIPPDIQDEARSLHGGVREMGAFVRRLLRQHRERIVTDNGFN